MATGADNEGQNPQVRMQQLFKDPLAAQAVYERAPNGTARIAATYNYSGDEDALAKILTNHVNQLWTPQERLTMGETQTALFRHARAACQRIEDKIYLTLAYPEDFSKRRNHSYTDKRVGITAYSVHFPAEEKPTEENTRVKAFKDNIRTLFQLYNLSRPRLFPGKEEGQLTNDPDKVLTASKGYEKLLILEDVVSKYQQTEPKSEATTREATEEELGFFDDSAFQKMEFPEPPKIDRKTPNPDLTSKKPAPEKPRRLHKVDLSKLIQLNVPPVLEEKNGFFDSLFLHVTQLCGEYEAGKIFETDKAKFERERATVYALKDLCFRTQTGPDGNLCYIVTPESLEALRQATLSALVKDKVKNLAAAYDRIAMRAKNVWELGGNARAITDQRDSLAAEVRTLRKTRPAKSDDTLFIDDASTVTPDAHADLRYKNIVSALASHLQSSERTEHLLAFGQRVTTEYQAKNIDDPLIPEEIRELAEAAEVLGKYLENKQGEAKKDTNLVHDAQVVHGLNAQLERVRAEERAAAETRRNKAVTDAKEALKAEFDAKTQSLEQRAAAMENELNELRRKADKLRVAEQLKAETEAKNKKLAEEKDEALGKHAKIAADYAKVVKLFTELEQEVREALEGDA